MARWVWRCFLFLVGILVTSACGQNPANRANTPAPTLHRFTPSANILPPAIRPSITLTPLGGLPLLNVLGSTCHETPARSLICLGWVQNSLETAYENIRVRVQLVNENGQVVMTETTTISREWLPSGGGSPYRVIFLEAPAVNVTPQISLIEAAHTHVVSQQAVLLAARNVAAEREGDFFRVAGLVYNDTEHDIGHVKVVISLRNVDGAVVGFRVVEIPALAAQESADFVTTIIPQSPVEDYHVEITADGYRH